MSVFLGWTSTKQRIVCLAQVHNKVTPPAMQKGNSFNDMGESSKFPKSWTFKTPILKLAIGPLNIHNFKFKWPLVCETENKSEKAIIISLIQDFEADFLWKVSLKILNSGIILKTCTTVMVNYSLHYSLQTINSRVLGPVFSRQYCPSRAWEDGINTAQTTHRQYSAGYL